MKKQMIGLWAVAIVTLSNSDSLAQKRMLTVEESVKIGLENSKILHASLMRADYADAKESEASASLYPSLRLQAAYLKLSSVPEFRIPLPPGIFPGNAVVFPIILNYYSARATVQQPLFTGWRLQSMADNASYQAEASHRDLDRDKAELIYGIRAAYWNLCQASDVKRLADENVTRITAHLNDIENLSNQGLATNNEVLKVRVQLSNATIMQSDAENAVRIAALLFNSTIGIDLNSDVVPSSPLTSTERDFPEVQQLLEAALTRRPDVQAMEWRLQALDAGITAARAGWLPQIFLTGNYYYARPNSRIFPAKDEFKDSWDLGISLQIDLWNNLTALNQTSAAKAQYEQTKDALATMKDGITLEVTQSYLNFNQAKQRIRLSQLGVEQANENYRITAEKFKAGLTTNSELLDAEVLLLQTKLQLTQARVDYELAEARLEKGIGTLN
jgi:outer membrane protein TolC